MDAVGQSGQGTPVLARRLGAALAGSSAPGAIYAAWWSGIGDAGWHVWLLGLALAALLGALTWPVFVPAPEDSEAPGIGFGALFSATAGMLAGTLVAFPMGGVFGFVSGLVSGAVTAALWSRLSSRPMAVRAGVSFSVGAIMAFAVVAGWLA